VKKVVGSDKRRYINGQKATRLILAGAAPMQSETVGRPMEILLVEDSLPAARITMGALKQGGIEHRLTWLSDGNEASLFLHQTDRYARAPRPDLVLLDLMLPRGSGFDVCREVGARDNGPAIIVLTARHDKDDKVRALDLGADDYVTKPFALDELLARVRAVLRRSYPAADRIALGPIVVDFRTMRATRGQQDLGLGHGKSSCCGACRSARGGS
jgi:DNA-binding response OmpR family regulator